MLFNSVLFVIFFAVFFALYTFVARTRDAKLALILAGALVLGLLVGQPWPVLTTAALGVVAWHYWKLRHVLLRLTARQRLAPPRGAGVWNELDRLLYRPAVLRGLRG